MNPQPNNESGKIQLKTRADLNKKEFFDEKPNKYRVKKLINLTNLLKRDDYDIELDEMKFTKLKKYADYPLVKITKDELKKILANYDLREETYLTFLGIQKLENNNYSLQLDVYLDKFIRINLKEITFEENCEVIYKIFDKDNKGYITKTDMQNMITYFHEINSLIFDEGTLQSISEAIYKNINKTNQGTITKPGMFKYLEKYREEDITINPFTRVKTSRAITKIKQAKTIKMTAEEEKVMERITRKKDRSKLRKFWFLNKKMIIWTIVYATICTISALGNMALEPKNNGNVPDTTTFIARFWAGIIFINLTFIILFMCNYVNSFLSSTRLKYYLPLGDTKLYHAVCACVMGIAIIPHVLYHLLGDFPFIAKRCLQRPNKGICKEVTVTWLVFKNIYGISGVVLLVLFSIMIIVPLIRPIVNKKYEWFLNTHKLFYPALVFLIIHCRTPQSTRWPLFFFMVIPFTLFALELIVRLIRFISNKTKIYRVKYLSSGVIMLEIEKPKKFNFKCGQYAQLSIPSISKWQWHPFTFASSPSDVTLVFYISPSGDWTKQLKNFSPDVSQNSQNNNNNNSKDAKVKVNSKEECLKPDSIVRIDGPHGAPAEHFNDYEHVIFVAGGVGATPFSSILIGLLYKLKRDEKMTHKTITFFWIQREYEKFDYLNNILEEIAVEDKERKFEINIFVTSAQQKYDFRSLFIAEGIELIKRDSKGRNISEICSGNVFWGRPDWDEIFKQKTLKLRRADNQEGCKVGVFVCGNDAIVSDIYEVCENYSSAAVTLELNTEHF